MNRYTLSLRPPVGEGTLVVAYVGAHATWSDFVELMWQNGYRPDGGNGEVDIAVLENGGGE